MTDKAARTRSDAADKAEAPGAGARWVALRRRLHQHPELSDQEIGTAALIRDLIVPFGPDVIVDRLGGHGLAFVFDSGKAGPTTLIRCELDGLPIEDTTATEYRSLVPGAGHQCGHDGHMTIVSALAADLGRRRPQCGRVVLLYQPAEETGAGASRVVNDPAFEALRPDYAFALHNVPGLALGTVAVKSGPINCASRGMAVTLKGATSHAAHPEHGVSPAQAMAGIIQQLSALPDQVGAVCWVTVVHARLGHKSFGTAPGEAVVMATLRSETDEAMETLATAAEQLVREAAVQHGLKFDCQWEDVFSASANSDSACAQVLRACEQTGTPYNLLDSAYRWSEDFGRLSASARHGALLGLGSGVDCPQLHNGHYDFPDSLIPIGTQLFRQLVDQINSAGSAQA